MFLKNYKSSLLLLLISFLCITKAYATPEELIELAGDQRMHIQLLAKNYFYVHGEVFSDKVKKSMKHELRVYNENSNKLRELVNDTRHKRSMESAVNLKGKFVALLNSKKYNLNEATEMIEVSDKLTRIYDSIVTFELKRSKNKKLKFLDLLEQQTMIIEKMAKYYVAYTMGVNDKNTFQSLMNSVNEFDKNHKLLLKQRSNVPTAIKDLKRISKTWKTMKGYYTSIDEAQLPAMVLITTDRILKSLRNIINIYTEQERI